MALIGLSLLLASVVWVLVRPPAWLPSLFLQWRGIRGTIADGSAQAQRPRQDKQDSQTKEEKQPAGVASQQGSGTGKRDAMPPPPVPQIPSVQPPPTETPRIAEPEADEQTTPKAAPAIPSIAVPSFSLSPEPPAARAASSAMPPPPPPLGRRAPQPGRMPTLPQFPAANSPQRAQGPLPNRGPPASSGSGLAPPPTHSSKPAKPSRKVLLSPGHSPLDWARISGPNADLRGLPASTPYLRVTPSMLKKQTGRKGKDAWMALNGKVYNVTPYAKFHPGGVPELMRGAARDGTQLFGEIHPWVNYESMLSACLVGLLVDEPEGQESEMDKMD
ncbi:Cytochrome b5 reductase 4 [Paramyrothecium foliicola]|nr:Cytochrome b5 reductase 4 [Paramyrothecium foliicola]